MPNGGGVSRREALVRLGGGFTLAFGGTGNGVARTPERMVEPRDSAGLQIGTGTFGGEYVLERYDGYARVMPINVVLRTDKSIDEIWQVLRSAGWTTLTGSSLSGHPKYARDEHGTPVREGLDVADEMWNFDPRDQRTHASLWKFHEGDELENVSIGAHVDVGTAVEMRLDVKFSELVGSPASVVGPGHSGAQFDSARDQLVRLFTANGWEEVGQVEYADDHGSEGHWRDHDGFAAVLEPAESAGAKRFPYRVETGSATADGPTVTFTGTVTAPSGDVTVGFAWQDDNAIWGETDAKTFVPAGTREFSITGEVPRTAFEYPYYAWAVFHDLGDDRYRGDVREVLVPDFSDAVRVETLGVDAGTESATIRGRVAEFSEAREIPVGAEVSEDGGVWYGVSRETKTPDDSPTFAVEVGDLEPSTEYLGRAFGAVSSGPGSKKITGEATSFTTEEEDGSDEIAVETGEASPNAETPRYVTFSGRIGGLPADATVEVGFEYQDYNAMWGETGVKEVTEEGTSAFAITEQMPYVGREFPYRAVAAVERPSGTQRYVGETRTVAVPNFVDTIEVETADVAVSGTTVTVYGRVTDFGKATTVLANAEVWRPGSNVRTSRTERVRLSADGSPEFEVRLTDLDPDEEYRARTMAEIPAGPTSATTYGSEVGFTTEGSESATETPATNAEDGTETPTGASDTTTTTEEPTTATTTADESTTTTTTEERTTTTTTAEEPTTSTTEEPTTTTTTADESTTTTTTAEEPTTTTATESESTTEEFGHRGSSDS